MLSRDMILGANDLPTETMTVPQWGGEVLLRVMTGAQREDLEGKIRDAQAKGAARNTVRALAVVYSVANDKGELLFTIADAPALAAKSGVALDLIFDRILKLNAMTKEEAGEVAKN